MGHSSEVGRDGNTDTLESKQLEEGESEPQPDNSEEDNCDSSSSSLPSNGEDTGKKRLSLSEQAIILREENIVADPEAKKTVGGILDLVQQSCTPQSAPILTPIGSPHG